MGYLDCHVGGIWLIGWETFDAGGIGVLEELRRPGGDMRVRAGADRGGVVLDEQHRHEGHERHRGHQQHGPAEAVKGQLRPPAPADRVGAEAEPAHEDERQRQRVGHVGEAQHGEREADGAAARGQDPQRLVGAQGIGQQQPDEAEPSRAEQDDRRRQGPQRVGDRREGLVARLGVGVPGEREQRDGQEGEQEQPRAGGPAP